ncbi:hypothetical protein Ahy_B08g090656 isoform C [Arachis hypogaea]|uniref:Uncharacterized protein n=1 Tax=Arachis hypogaea TaxID=3818 RepID=A0A444Y0D4_ARAHY|nr:hypothetical protein Ahy_B08g090656 isoform C [Arachis hypogaea]
MLESDLIASPDSSRGIVHTLSKNIKVKPNKDKRPYPKRVASTIYSTSLEEVGHNKGSPALLVQL